MGQKYKYSIRKYEYCQLNIIKKEKKVNSFMGQKYKYSIRKYEYCQLNIIKKEKKVLFLFIFKEK